MKAAVELSIQWFGKGSDHLVMELAIPDDATLPVVGDRIRLDADDEWDRDVIEVEIVARSWSCDLEKLLMAAHLPAGSMIVTEDNVVEVATWLVGKGWVITDLLEHPDAGEIPAHGWRVD